MTSVEEGKLGSPNSVWDIPGRRQMFKKESISDGLDDYGIASELVVSGYIFMLYRAPPLFFSTHRVRHSILLDLRFRVSIFLML
jgi:hypothetical protein